MTPRLVTVAIPVRNGAAVISNQLNALSSQRYPHPWEVLVVDNGSTDDTVAVVSRFAKALPDLRVVHEPRPGIGPARNRALAETQGDLLAICDADDVVQPGWLAALVEGLEEHDLVGGFADMRLANPPEVLAWRGTLPEDELPIALGAWPFAPGGNLAVRVDAARAIGGWDEGFVAGSDDVDFSWRLVQAGYRLGFAPRAVLSYQVRPGLWGLLQQFYRYGRSEALLYKKHRAQGLPHYTLRQLWNVWRRLGPAAVRALPGKDPDVRAIALRRLAYHAGRLVGSVKHRVLFP